MWSTEAIRSSRAGKRISAATSLCHGISVSSSGCAYAVALMKSPSRSCKPFALPCVPCWGDTSCYPSFTEFSQARKSSTQISRLSQANSSLPRVCLEGSRPARGCSDSAASVEKIGVCIFYCIPLNVNVTAIVNACNPMQHLTAVKHPAGPIPSPPLHGMLTAVSKAHSPWMW